MSVVSVTSLLRPWF